MEYPHIFRDSYGSGMGPAYHKGVPLLGVPENQWLFLVPLKGGIGSIFIPQKARTISGIYLGGYMPPTTF